MEPGPAADANFPLAALPASTPVGTLPTAPVTTAETRNAVLESLKGSGGKVAALGAAPTPLPLAAGLPPAWLAPPAVPAPALAVIPPPANASIVTVDDRQVRLGVPEAKEQPTLYRLCRQWVHNDPNLGQLSEPTPASKLPPLAPPSEEAAAAMQQPAPAEPLFPAAAAAGTGAGAGPAASSGGSGAAAGAEEGEAAPAVKDLLTHHQQHWKAVRQHHQARAAAGMQRYEQRLQAVMAAGALPMPEPAAVMPLPMQP